LRVHLPKEIKRALEFGDLRENSEYRAALDRQNVVKARIVELRQRISEISSIDLSKISRDKAVTARRWCSTMASGMKKSLIGWSPPKRAIRREGSSLRRRRSAEA